MDTGLHDSQPSDDPPDPKNDEMLRIWHNAMRQHEGERRKRLLLGVGSVAVAAVLVGTGWVIGRFSIEPTTDRVGSSGVSPEGGSIPAVNRTTASNPCAVVGSQASSTAVATEQGPRSSVAGPAPAVKRTAAANPCAPGAPGVASRPATPEDIIAAIEAEEVAPPLTPAEIAGARRRVFRMEGLAVTQDKRTLLDEKRAVAETWIQSIGHDGARIKARKTIRAFVAAAKAAKAEKGKRAPEVVEALASAMYWRDICDLVVVAKAQSQGQRSSVTPSKFPPTPRGARWLAW
jgi:hypothetical protein